MRRTLCAIAAWLSLGCEGPRATDAGDTSDASSPDDAATMDAAVGAVARFALGGPPLDFADVPFPSDLYLDAEGHARVGALPSSRDATPFFDGLRAMMATREGFSPIGAVHFGIDGALDPASLPPSRGQREPASLEDGVVLVDADAASPEHLRLVPLRVVHDRDRGLLSVRPARGHVLRPGGRYAAALTSALRGADGSPLAPSDTFRALRDGEVTAPPGLEGALQTLEAAGVPRARVVSATGFDVEDPGRELVGLRAAVHGAPPPVAAVDRVYLGPDGSLDDYFGVPATARPGVDVANAPGTEGEHALVHETTQLVVLGRFTAPRVVTGAGSDVGTPRRDAAGALEAGPSPRRARALPGLPARRVPPVRGRRDERRAARARGGPRRGARRGSLARRARARRGARRHLGISMGSVVGASMLAGEPDLRGLVLNVPPGSVVDTLCEGAEFRGLATGPLAGFLGIRGPFDEVGRSCAMDPIVDLFRWMLAPIDPLALAPHFFRERLVAGSSFDGSPPDVLWLLANHDQLAAPPATESMLAVAGAPGRGDFGFVELASAPSPAWRNLVAPGGGVTAVALRYAPASHGLPEVLAGTSSYEDPLDPPFVRRAAETRFDNPILDVHARTTRFLEGIARGEHATVE